MSRPKTPVPLVTKIARVFASVERLQRKGTHERGFRYTRAHDVFELVRGKLLEQGVIVCPVENLPVYVSLQSNGGELLTECRLQVTYTFKDEKETLDPPIVINGLGRSVGDEALEIAQTKAQKALLKRFGIMADEQDDAPVPTDDTSDDASPAKTPRTPSWEQPVTRDQIRAFASACQMTGKTDQQVMEYLFHQHQVSGVKDLRRGKPFQEALKWAANGASAQAPKPQAAPPLQGSLPLPRVTPPIEMRIGNQTVTVEPKTGSYSV
jgi:hypothetical protein